MKTTRVPALVYETTCFRCERQLEVPIFDGGGFYHFATYRGPSTGRFYRLDLQALAHQADLHRASIDFESGLPLELVPDAMCCPACGKPIGLAESALRTLRPQVRQFGAVLL